MRYAIIIEPSKDGSYWAYIPDLPGCVSCGDTIEEVKRMIVEAAEFHLESMIADGDPIPPATSVAATIEVRPANAAEAA